MNQAVAENLLITAEEYLEGEPLADIRHEYIEGEVHAMAEPKGSVSIGHPQIIETINCLIH